MKFVAIVEYNSDKALADQHRPDHRSYCGQLKESGQLAASGPLTDGFGGLFIYEVDTPEVVGQIIQGDPFYRAGVFKTWKIHPWTIVFCNSELFEA